MVKKKKEKCSTCHDKGFIEKLHGLIQQPCPEECAALTSLRENIDAQLDEADRANEAREQATVAGEPGGGTGDNSEGEGGETQADPEGTGEPDGSNTDEETGDKEPGGETAPEEVQAGT